MKKICLVVLAAGAVTFTACGPQTAHDTPGVYADGENFIVINPAAHRINYAGDGTKADALLAATEKGEGLGYTTWRDKTSCGLQDASGNLFVLPRGDRVDRDNATITVETEAPAAKDGQPPVTGKPVTGKVIALRTDNLVRIKYLYDDAIGVRYIDQYDPNGEFDRRIWLERGTGFLGHCRGFSVDDFR